MKKIVITAERLALSRVKKEARYGRDLRINVIHRTWGRDVAATDIDFLEYSRGKSIAIIDMKESDYWRKKFKRGGWKSVNAYLDLAARAKLPFFIVEYDVQTHDHFKVVPMNVYARKFIKEDTVMNEQEYVCFQYKLRDPENEYVLSEDAIAEMRQKREELLRNFW